MLRILILEDVIVVKEKPMSLSAKIDNAFKDAYKAKDAATVSTLRLLKSALKNKQIDLMKELTDEDVIGVLKSQIKQLTEARDIAREAGREETAQEAQVEIELLEQYLPAQMSDEELEPIVQAAVEASGATSKADFGKAMGAAMKAAEGKADGNRVREMVQKFLPVIALTIAGVSIAEPSFAAESEFLSHMLPTTLRVLRVLLMMLGIVAVTQILKGGFDYMFGSGRDDSYSAAMAKMSQGVLISMFLAGLFAVITIAIGKF